LEQTRTGCSAKDQGLLLLRDRDPDRCQALPELHIATNSVEATAACLGEVAALRGGFRYRGDGREAAG